MRTPERGSQTIGVLCIFDENKCLRVGGRLQSSEGEDALKHPLILAEDHFTTLVIRYTQRDNVAHLRTDVVLTQIRLEFWILRARQLIKKELNNCIICKRCPAKSSGQIEAPLPGLRTEQGGVFRNVGIDYLDPFEMIEGKVWISLFTCSVTRAIHLETVADLSAEAFLDALKRFVATRSVPEIVSDNGLNFVRAARALKVSWSNL